MTIDAAFKRQLRSRCHHLKPVVMVGQHGLSDNILEEVEIALDHHELIKVRVVAEKAERQQIIEKIVSHTGADLVQTIGHMAALYRPAPDKKKKKKS